MSPSHDDMESLQDLLRSLEELEEKIEEKRTERCVVFIDIVGYTSFVDRHGDVAGRRRVEKAAQCVLPIVENHKGRLVKSLGDGWLLLFTSPEAAIRAAIEIQRSNTESQKGVTDPIRLKIGIDYGRLLEDSSDVYGDVVNVSSRLAGLCQGDRILISNAVYEAVGPYYRKRCVPVEDLRIRGKSSNAVAYEIQWEPLQQEEGVREPFHLVLEVLWGERESRVNLSSSSEESVSLISYDTVALDLEEIEKTADRIRKVLSSANFSGSGVSAENDLRKWGCRLFSLLLPEQVGERIRRNRDEFLLLKLDDACVHLPWELLHDGNDFLCCRFSVGRLVRTRQSIRVTRRSFPTEGVSFLALSNPTGDLPAATEEAKELFDLCREDPRVRFEWANQRITFSSIQDRLTHFDMVHYCGHAEYDSENPDASGWVLSNGRFTAGDLEDYAKNHLPAPLLVFNNACHSGTTRSWNETRDNWSHGLANAFLLAGTLHYIGAVSELLDLRSKELSKTFYRYVLEGHPVARALRLTRNEYRRKHSDTDLTWAPYVLYGDPQTSIYGPFVETEGAGRKKTAATHSPREESATAGVTSPTAQAVPTRGSDSEPEQPLSSGHKEEEATTPARKDWKLAGVLAVACMALVVGVLNRGTHEDVSTMVHEAIVLADSGNLDSALLMARKALSLDPDDPETRTVVRSIEHRVKALENEKLRERIRESLERLEKMADEQGGQQVDRWTSRPPGLAVLPIDGAVSSEEKALFRFWLESSLRKAYEETGRWFPLERGNLDALMQELRIGASNLTEQTIRSGVGRFFPVSGLLTSRITPLDKGRLFQFRVSEVETRRVVATVTSATTEPLSSGLADRMVRRLVESLEKDYELRGRILTVDGQNGVLNVGTNHGVRSGLKLDVYFKEDDPEYADFILGLEPIGKIEVTDVGNNKASFRVIHTEIPLEAGMRVRETKPR